MTKEERRTYVEDFKELNYCYKETKNGLVFNDHMPITKLGIIADFESEDETPILLKHGDFSCLEKTLKIFDKLKDGPVAFNIKLIRIPVTMYKWVNVIIHHSASSWIHYLVEELEEMSPTY